ncbi:hypothetical protein [Polyangium mundeleinium]|uniref:Outer membrane protein beta-barrel domain-containing protein n=1 Tax=Polyangium mundeleinium TaxID=2995306 RepID=A0ABT5EX72_9BACT|nr:hypothetical protein [Polyangium mundeleinium]MDC0746004.1 hypothetical protein [Polyangium mundeleinium]
MGLALALLLLSAPAAAQTAQELPPPEAPTKLGFRYWHGDIAFGVRKGGGTFTLDGQLYAGVFLARTIKVPGWSPFLGAGMHLSAGEVTVDDRRGNVGKVGVSRFAVGPELRLGVARGKKVELFSRAWPHVQFYVSSALTMVFADGLSDRLPEAGHGWDFKFGVGTSLPAVWSIFERDPVSWLMIMFPNTIAFDMEVPLGEPSRARYGARLGYGF